MRHDVTSTLYIHSGSIHRVDHPYEGRERGHGSSSYMHIYSELQSFPAKYPAQDKSHHSQDDRNAGPAIQQSSLYKHLNNALMSSSPSTSNTFTADPVFHQRTTLPPISKSSFASLVQNISPTTTHYPETKPNTAIKMHHNRGTTTTTTRTTRPSFMSRFRGTRTARTHHTTPVHHHKRHATFGDKISGAMLKLKGSLTHRPAVKVC